MSGHFLKVWLGGLVLLLGMAFSVPLAWAAQPLRIGLTPTFLNERHGLIGEWQAYLEAKLGQPVKFVLRESYQEAMELLQQQELDVAWLCDCPHVTANPEFRLLVTPLFQGRPFYRAYLIVPETDHATRSVFALKGKVFAYTDPYSNVGYLSPRYEIKKSGADPDRFFRRTFFAHSHRKAIEAVAVGIADGATVNSYIWETINKQGPALTGKTRLAASSREYGFPPFVAHQSLPNNSFQALQKALIGMDAEGSGRKILERMNLDGFTVPQPEIYREVQNMVHYMRGH